MAGENKMSNITLKRLNPRILIHWMSMAREGIGEIKLVRSWQDVKILHNKFSYILPRTIGLYEKVDEIPPSIQIEPTNYCNARCICCSTSRSDRKRGFMDFNLFKKIIDDAAQSNIKRVHLFLHGEPMLHPRIIEMIAFIKARGLAINLTTNGMLFNREKIAAILNANVNFADHFIFSILGGSREIHEATMKRVNHERVMENISTFLELRKKYHLNGPVIETMFYPMPENQHEVSLYLKTYQNFVDHARVAGAISYSFAQYNTLNEGKNIKPRTKTCSQLWERLTIFWNGDVTVCPQDINGARVFGNLAEQSIREVCMNENLLSIKRMHKQKLFEKLPYCYVCD